MFPCNTINFSQTENVIDDELKKLGKISKEEKRVLLVFGITVSLWITRTIINEIFPGLKLSDTIISLIGAVSLFVIPMNMKTGKFVLEWKDTEKLAWGILILFGGGLSLAKGMASSGVVDVITDSIQNSGFNPFIVISLLIVLNVIHDRINE